MTGVLTTLAELINPNWVRHSAVPPLEAGLRPNDRLDRATALVTDFEVDDMVVHGESVVVAHGDELRILDGSEAPHLLTTLPGPVTALATTGQALLAAVQGTGIVEIDASGRSSLRSDDARLLTCVTAMCVLADGTLAVAVGSSRFSYQEWRQAVVHADRTGSVLRLQQSGATVLADRLGWPAGTCPWSEDELLVSVSNEYRIDVLPLASGKRRSLVQNLPAFPGRITAADGSWLVAFPYVRNRLSELLLEEKDFVDAMVAEVDPSEWLLPQLRTDNPYRSALQLGQLRVLGMLKPWAPARTYGLVGVLDARGKFASSLQSRVDGVQHGVTAALRTAEGVLIAVCGSRNLLLAEATK